MCLLGISQYSQFPMTAQKLWFLGCPPRLYKKNDSEIFWISINLWHTQYITVPNVSWFVQVPGDLPGRLFHSGRSRWGGRWRFPPWKLDWLKGKSDITGKCMDFHGFPTWNISRFPMVSCFFQPFQWDILGKFFDFHGVPGLATSGPCPARCESGSRSWSVHPCGEGPHSGTICWWLGDADFHLISVEIKAESSRMLKNAQELR